MAEVRIAVRKHAVEDFAPHQVVLHVALAVPPGERAVLILMEAHHDAGLVEASRVVDGRGLQVPAHLALRVDDGVLRVVVPLKRAARRVVPDRAAALGRFGEQIVDEVEAVAEALGGRGHDLRIKGLDGAAVCPRGIEIHGRRPDAVGLRFFNRPFSRLLRPLHLDFIQIFGIKAEDGDAAVGAKRGRAHIVGDFRAALFGNDAHVSLEEHFAAVADDCRKGSDVIGIHDDFAELALPLKIDLGSARTAHGEYGRRRCDQECGAHGAGNAAKFISSHD